MTVPLHRSSYAFPLTAGDIPSAPQISMATLRSLTHNVGSSMTTSYFVHTKHLLQSVLVETVKADTSLEEKQEQLRLLLEKLKLKIDSSQPHLEETLIEFLKSGVSPACLDILQAYYLSPCHISIQHKLGDLSTLATELLSDTMAEFEGDLQRALDIAFETTTSAPMEAVDKAASVISKPTIFTSKKAIQVGILLDLIIPELAEQQVALGQTSIDPCLRMLKEQLVDPDNAEQLTEVNATCDKFQKVTFEVIKNLRPKAQSALETLKPHLIAYIMDHFSEEEVHVLYAYKASPLYPLIQRHQLTLSEMVNKHLKKEMGLALEAFYSLGKA